MVNHNHITPGEGYSFRPELKINHREIQRIMLVRLSSIGDVLLASPVAEKVRQHYPNARITWVVESKSKDVIVGNPFVDEVIVWPRTEWQNQAKRTRNYLHLIRQTCTFIQSIRDRHPDLVINMQGMLRSALIGFFSGAKYRICPANGRELSTWFANCIVDNETEKHAMHQYVSLLSPLGIELSDMHMHMSVTNQDLIYADKLISQHGLREGQFVTLDPSASQEAKCWPTEYYAALADQIIEEYHLGIVLLGAPSDQARVAEIIGMMTRKANDVSGETTLKQLGAIVKKSRMFISGDTGPLHIAAAVGTPTVSIFGPSNSVRYAPVGKNHVALTGESMRDVNLSQVLAAVRQLLTVI